MNSELKLNEDRTTSNDESTGADVSPPSVEIVEIENQPLITQPAANQLGNPEIYTQTEYDLAYPVIVSTPNKRKMSSPSAAVKSKTKKLSSQAVQENGQIIDQCPSNASS